MTYDDFDGLGLADLVRRRVASPLELLEAAVARTERLNPTINAVITPMIDDARRTASGALPPGPFAGVPFLVKDLSVSIPGHRLSNGCRALLGQVPTEECQQARTIRQAGLVTFGKTNTSELGTSSLTNPQAFGPTRNPWDLSRNAGGSSGGSAAAVAARMVPMASSSDGGGSIRLPAAYCGVFGFKPSRGLNPYDPAEAWGGAVVSQVTTLTVRDSAAYLDWSSAGRCAEDPASPPADSFLARTLAFPDGLRVGFTVQSPAGGLVHHDCTEAVERAAAVLCDLGHEVEACRLPYHGRDLLRSFVTVVMAAVDSELEDMARALGVARSALDLEPFTAFLGEAGTGVSPTQLEHALEVWRKTDHQMRAFHARHDILLTPVSAMPPLRHHDFDPTAAESTLMRAQVRLRLGRHLFGNRLLDKVIGRTSAAVPFTQVANATGQPAMSVPLYWNGRGLPIGVQFIAAPGNDGLLFSLAAQLEAACPWRDKRPPDGDA
jgi:amidase